MELINLDYKSTWTSKIKEQIKTDTRRKIWRMKEEMPTRIVWTHIREQRRLRLNKKEEVWKEWILIMNKMTMLLIRNNTRWESQALEGTLRMKNSLPGQIIMSWQVLKIGHLIQIMSLGKKVLWRWKTLLQ